ncbi:MAG: hypothetical protein R3E79_36615 [Caldilineaceae bacterium]
MTKAVFTDTQRDAEKYRLLVRALRHATTAVQAMEEQGRPTFEVLTKLLPDIADAPSAQKAFILRRTNGSVDGQPRSKWSVSTCRR